MTHRPGSNNHNTPPPGPEHSVFQTEFLARQHLDTLRRQANRGDPEARWALNRLKSEFLGELMPQAAE